MSASGPGTYNPGMSYQRGPYGGGGVTIMVPPVTPMMKWILIALSVSFGVQVMLRLTAIGPLVESFLALDPSLVLGRGMVWQVVTYAMLHGDIFHLLFNLLGIWMFGGDVERILGSKGFLKFVVICAVGGAVLHLAVALLVEGGGARVIGVSGSVLGILVAFALFYPDRQIFLFPLPVPVKAWIVAIVFGAINLYNAVSANQGGGIAFVAHLGGMLTGWLYIKGFIKPGGWNLSRFRSPKRRGFKVIEGDRRDPFLH